MLIQGKLASFIGGMCHRMGWKAGNRQAAWVTVVTRLGITRSWAASVRHGKQIHIPFPRLNKLHGLELQRPFLSAVFSIIRAHEARSVPLGRETQTRNGDQQAHNGLPAWARTAVTAIEIDQKMPCSVHLTLGSTAKFGVHDVNVGSSQYLRPRKLV
jgi:hypothetical protein